MGWEKRNGNGTRYYYRSVRIGVRVEKRYVGRGKKAEDAANRADELKRDRRSRRDEMSRLASADRQLDEFRDIAEVLVSAVLLTAGCHLHHGQWRRRRHG